MGNGEMIKEILQQIKENRIDAREGLKRINELKQQAPSAAAKAQISEEAVEQMIKDVLCRIVKLQPDELLAELSFKEMGIDSISSVEIVRDLNDALHIQMDGIQLYDYPTIPELTRYIWNEVRKNGPIPAEAAQEQASTAPEPGTRQRLNHRYEYMNDLIDQFSKASRGLRPPLPAAGMTIPQRLLRIMRFRCRTRKRLQRRSSYWSGQCRYP